MLITRRPKFYYDTQDSSTWNRFLSSKDLKNKHAGWEFKEFSTYYRFINPERTEIKYYNFNGKVESLSMSVILEEKE